MRHRCSNCSGEFFDDDSSTSPSARVFCVFCGTPQPLSSQERSSGVPFSADVEREESFALGVISAPNPEFPETLKQFRAGGTVTKPSIDSLSPLEGETEPLEPQPELPPWRLRKFWMSLAVGFGVGAVAAAVLGQRTAARPVAAVPLVAPKPAAPGVAISGCPAVPMAAPVVSSEPVAVKKAP
ncbi:MAG TPA: hypothetical protein VEQ59_00225, partial [Polyangiaceae bacterium]|nr:hypothetical protein [Polyangiaceae bacterium]